MIEDQASRDALRGFLAQFPADYVEMQVAMLFDEGGFRDRFNYLAEHIDTNAKQQLLVSGASVGTELKVALDYGFVDVTGTEVAQPYADITNGRFAGSTTLRAIMYDGKSLPFPDGHFSCVVSGHIIEHTPSPREYLNEHLRVMRPGAFLMLEYPTRYHWTELHTGLPSLEWLPRPVRNVALRAVTSPASPVTDAKKARYRAILDGLQPIGRFQIRRWIAGHATMIHHAMPAPGIERLVIRKH
jgi:SAM-dependent methyltransferase